MPRLVRKPGTGKGNNPNPPPKPPIITADPAPAIFKDFRSKLDLSQSEAAELFGVHETTWGTWEKGVRPQVTARLLATLLLAKPELIKLLLEHENLLPG